MSLKWDSIQYLRTIITLNLILLASDSFTAGGTKNLSTNLRNNCAGVVNEWYVTKNAFINVLSIQIWQQQLVME